MLQEAIDGFKLNRNIPLQRQKAAEISFVLKAIATVVASMKKASQTSGVSKKTWTQVMINLILNMVAVKDNRGIKFAF